MLFAEIEKYVFVTPDPEAIKPLIGREIRGYTGVFHYVVKSLSGCRGILEMIRKPSASDVHLKDVPLSMVDFAQ